MAVPVGRDVEVPLESAARVAAVGAAGGAGAGVRAGAVAGMADALPADVQLYVQREGAAGCAEVTTARVASVARLTEQIQEKLKMTESLDALTLHVKEMGAAGPTLGPALDSTATVAEALDGLVGKIRVVVKVSNAASAGHPNGTSHSAAAGVANDAGMPENRLGEWNRSAPMPSPTSDDFPIVDLLGCSFFQLEPFSFETSAAAKSTSRALAKHIRNFGEAGLFSERNFCGPALAHLPAFAETIGGASGNMAAAALYGVRGLRAGKFTFPMDCKPELHVRGKVPIDTAVAAGLVGESRFVPGLNGQVKSVTHTALRQAVFYALMDMARIFFTPPPATSTRVRFFRRPPAAFALLSFPHVGYYLAVEWIGRVLVSAASAPFILQSAEHQAAVAALPRLAFGEPREVDVKAGEKWTALAAPTPSPSPSPSRRVKFYRRDGSRFQKLLFFDAYHSDVWASMARVYRRLSELQDACSAGKLLLPPPSAVVLDAQMWFGAHVALVDMLHIDDAEPMDSYAFVANPAALAAVSRAVAWLAYHGVVYTDMRGPNTLMKHGGGAEASTTSSSSGAGAGIDGGAGASCGGSRSGCGMAACGVNHATRASDLSPDSGASEAGLRSFTLIDYDDCFLSESPISTYDGFVEALRRWRALGKEREFSISWTAAMLIEDAGADRTSQAAGAAVVAGADAGSASVASLAEPAASSRASGEIDITPLRAALREAFAALPDDGADSGLRAAVTLSGNASGGVTDRAAGSVPLAATAAAAGSVPLLSTAAAVPGAVEAPTPAAVHAGEPAVAQSPLCVPLEIAGALSSSLAATVGTKRPVGVVATADRGGEGWGVPAAAAGQPSTSKRARTDDDDVAAAEGAGER